MKLTLVDLCYNSSPPRLSPLANIVADFCQKSFGSMVTRILRGKCRNVWKTKLELCRVTMSADTNLLLSKIPVLTDCREIENAMLCWRVGYVCMDPISWLAVVL